MAHLGGDWEYGTKVARECPNVYVDTAQYLLDGGIESLVADYGGRRLLFGSGFPESYMGGMMLAHWAGRLAWALSPRARAWPASNESASQRPVSRETIRKGLNAM